ncbi:MAG: AAA family ATPase [Pseudonocardiales bacterium]|nr:AAA family ATPase [Pseudonocardiales bacterium]MBV9029372.1 AAA family ATPase [Pseudonocardiales bacterium]
MSLPLSSRSRDPAGEGTRPSWGAMIGAACRLAAVSYLAAVVAIAMLAAAAGADSSVAGVARAGAVGWLAAHHVPLAIDGAPLGVLPLLPTLLLGALVARGAAGVAARTGIHQPADAGWVAGVVAGIHGALGVVLALAATPATVTADPGQTALGCALVAGVAAGLGLARPCGLLPAALRRAPGWVRPGLMAGLWGLTVLLTAGLATVLMALVASAPEVARMAGSDAGSALGLTVLSLGYLPNAVIAGLSWLAGPGLSVGALSVSALAVHAGPVPAVPLLAALPQGPVQPWWGVVLVVPVLVGAAVGRRCAAAEPDLPQRLRVLGVAAGVLALGSAVLGALAGGRLGAAAFDPVEVPFGTLAVAVLAATLLGGCAAILLPSPPAGTEPSTPDVNEPAPDQPDREPDPGAGNPAPAELS